MLSKCPWFTLLIAKEILHTFIEFYRLGDRSLDRSQFNNQLSILNFQLGDFFGANFNNCVQYHCH